MMSSSGHVKPSGEETARGSGGECGVEPRLLHASAGGGTGAGSIDNGLPPIVVVVSMDDSPSKSALLLNSSATYEIDIPQYNNRTYSPDSGVPDQESCSGQKSVDFHDSSSLTMEEDDKDVSLSQDSSSDTKIFGIPMSPDPIATMEPQVSHILPHPLPPNLKTEDTPDSNPAAATTTLDYTSIELPDTKEGIEELCPVCGDKVSGYHYGLLTCESCKGFFKRTVQNKKVYTCVADRSCQIDKTQRKRCPYCRFQKCIDVGMKLEAVRADRMRGGRNKFGPMYKRDRARKLQMMRQRQLSHPGLMSSRGVPSTTAVGITYSTGPYSVSSPIKEEIQSPFLSSSTSSPDSSPAPMQVVGAIPAAGATLSVSQGGANANVMAGSELSLWVGNVPPGAPGTPASGAGVPGAGNGNGNATRVGVVTAGGATPGATGDGSTGSESVTPTPVNSGGSSGGRVPPLIRQLLAQVDDSEWQSSLFSLLQNQTYNQCEVDLFELLCKVLDQNLFSQVDWARNSYFFKDLRVDDQMKLLQQSWSDMLIIDHLHQRIHNRLQNEMTLPNGQKFDLLSLALLGTTQFADRFQHIMNKLIDLKFDESDYISLKFILLLNPEIRSLNDRRSVAAAHEQVKQTLIDYCHAMYPNEQDRYRRLMELLPELHFIADNGERFLYLKHLHGAAPSQTLLMEMLHTKRR